MKPNQTTLFLIMTLVACSVSSSKQSETNGLDQLHSDDSCKSVDASDQLPLAYTCLSMTYNGKKDDRAPIVIMHGSHVFKELYIDLAKFLALKTARKVCNIDLRNHGASPWSDESDSKVMASDLALFRKTINADKLVLVGHSLGGKVAVEFALTYPDKVEKIVVEDMRPNGLSEEFMQQLDPNVDWPKTGLPLFPEGLNEYETKKSIVSFYEKLFETMNATLKFDENFIDYIPIKCSEGKCNWKFNIAVLGKMFGDILKFIPTSSGRCDKPALFIHGGVSHFKVDDVKEEILELFPEARLFKVEGRGHFLNPHPEYRNEVVNFINAKD